MYFSTEAEPINILNLAVFKSSQILKFYCGSPKYGLKNKLA
jgi:hypothetical protein